LYVLSFFSCNMFVSILEMDRFITFFYLWFVPRSFISRVIQFKIFDSFFRNKYYPIAWLSSKEKTISAKILHIKITSAWYSTIFQKRYRIDSKWQSWHFCLFKSYMCLIFSFWGQFLVYYTVPDLALYCEEIYIGNLEGFRGKGRICQRIRYSLGGTSIYSSAFWTCCLLDFEIKGWGAGNALETHQIYCFNSFSPIDLLHSYIFIFPPPRFAIFFPIFPPNIYSYSF